MFRAVKEILILFLFTLLLAAPGEAKTVKVFITNDVHGYIENKAPENGKPGMIGYAYLKGYINGSEANVKYLLDAGDAISGSVYTKVDYGQSIALLMGQMDYRYIIPGNREFDFNAATGKFDYYADVLETLRKSQKLYTRRKDTELCLSVSQNLKTADGGTLPNNSTQPVVIYDESKKDGVRIIVTGVTTTSTASKRVAPYLGNIIFGDKKSVLEDLEKSLQPYAREKDIVIVLSHVGLHEDKQYLAAQDIANVANVDIVSDAHSHKLSAPVSIGNATYVNGGNYLAQFVEITITSEGKYDVQIINYDKATQAKPDLNIVKAVEQITKYGEAEKVIGKLPEGMSFSNGDKSSMLEVTTLGRFIGQTMLEETGADIALFPGVGVRGKTFLADTVHKKDAYNLFMFLRNVVTIKMSGQEIKELFQSRFNSPDIFVKPDYGFPQFYGVEIELAGKTDDGYAVTDIKKDDVSILNESDKYYIVAVTSDLAHGNYEYSFDKKNIQSWQYPDLAMIIVKAFEKGAVNNFDFKQIQKQNLTIK